MKMDVERATMELDRLQILKLRGARGVRLLRRRGEYLERTFAHLYDTGGMRRTHLRGHHNIVKRILVHASGFNLGLVMRRLIGVGTPRGLQGRVAALIAMLARLWQGLSAVVNIYWTPDRGGDRSTPLVSVPTVLPDHRLEAGTCTTGC